MSELSGRALDVAIAEAMGWQLCSDGPTWHGDSFHGANKVAVWLDEPDAKRAFMRPTKAGCSQ